MSSLQGKRKEVGSKPQFTGGSVGAATPVAATVQETQDVDDMMSRMTIGSEFEAVLDLVNELIQRLNYLAVRIEEVDSKTLDATIDP
jgi:hypothetical protein